MNARDLIEALKETENKPKPYDTTAEVVRIEDGTAWVHIPGGEDETPVSMSVNASPGETVRVRVAGGQAWITGNDSAPPTDDTTAIRAEATAVVARDYAETALQDAEIAHEAALDAQASAAVASEAAGEAKASATNANEYASRALGGLSTVQSVAETLTWITQHGTMTNTQALTPPETALDPTHVYFVVDANGDYTVGSTHYSIVTEPDVNDIASYYVLSIDESLNNYVGTHLALTNDGLWLLPAAESTYKVLIAVGRTSGSYQTPGTYIIDDDGGIAAYFGTTVTIGKTTGSANANFTTTGFEFKTIDGEIIARMEETDTALNARPTDATETDTSHIYWWNPKQINSRNGVTISSSTIKLPQVKYQSGDTIQLRYIQYGFGLFNSTYNADLNRDYILTTTATDPWYYVETGQTVLEEGSNIRLSYASTSLTLTATSTTATQSLSVSLQKCEIINNVLSVSTVGTATVTLTATFNASKSTVTVTETLSLPSGTVPSDVYNALAQYGNVDIKGVRINAVYTRHAGGYAPEYVFGLKKPGVDSKAFALVTGLYNYSNAANQAIFGKYNSPDSNHAFEIGNGTADNARSNAFTVDWNGNITFGGQNTWEKIGSGDQIVRNKAWNYSDCNIAIETGWYFISAAQVSDGIANFPPTSDSVYFLVLSYSENFKTQFAFSREQNSQAIYWRNKVTAGWGAWKMVGEMNTTPTFTAPTMSTARATLASGGYYKAGKMVHVQMTMTIASARNANTMWSYASGFPTPAGTRVALTAYVNGKGTPYTACIDNGTLNLINGNTGTAVNDVVYITGQYIEASS